MPKLRCVDDKSTLVEFCKSNGYISRFKYTQEDPLKYHIMKGDNIISYYKFERKSNYKSGIYDSLGLFENRFNFLAFYRVFVYEGTYV